MAEESHPSILRFEHISVSFDGETALSGVSFEAFEGESHGPGVGPAPED